LHGAVAAQHDGVHLPAASQQRAVEVGAVDHGIRVGKAVAELLAERHPRDRLPCGAVHKPELIDEHRVFPYLVSDTEVVQRAEGVGC
jgi:hypothetical protein